MSAEDLIVVFPETALHRQTHLRAVAIGNSLDRFRHLWRDVNVHASQDRQRYADDDVIRADLGFLVALRVKVDDLYARVALVDRLHVGVEGDPVRPNRTL